MVDFSKAPEGATHYIKGCGVVSCGSHELLNGDAVFWITGDYFTWGNCSTWFSLNDLVVSCSPTPIPNLEVESKPSWSYSIDEFKGFDLNPVTCDNERELMLCEQVLRMCRGEDSQYQVITGDWFDNPKHNACLYIDCKGYREKPKKELVVPWDILSDEVTEIKVDKHGNIYDGGTPLRIKLDLTEINLPVTVKRP